MSKQPVETQTRKTPVHGMKWKRLGVDKDPDFNQTVFLYNDKITDPQDAVDIGWLKGIEVESAGKKFKFVINTEVGEEETSTEFSHYCEIKPPIE